MRRWGKSRSKGRSRDDRRGRRWGDYYDYDRQFKHEQPHETAAAPLDYSDPPRTAAVEERQARMSSADMSPPPPPPPPPPALRHPGAKDENMPGPRADAPHMSYPHPNPQCGAASAPPRVPPPGLPPKPPPIVAERLKREAAAVLLHDTPDLSALDDEPAPMDVDPPVKHEPGVPEAADKTSGAPAPPPAKMPAEPPKPAHSVENSSAAPRTPAVPHAPAYNVESAPPLPKTPTVPPAPADSAESTSALPGTPAEPPAPAQPTTPAAAPREPSMEPSETAERTKCVQFDTPKTPVEMHDSMMTDEHSSPNRCSTPSICSTPAIGAPSPALVPTVPHTPDLDERESALATAQQLEAQYPLDAHAIYSANRRTATSLAVPAALGCTREGQMHTVEGTVKLVAAQIKASDELLERKIAALRAEYRERHHAWLAYCAELDRQKERKESVHQVEESPSAPTSARSRRSHAGISGDAVRSEAEFLEILATLEHQDMQDPAQRAARTAAVIPDMDIRVDGRRRPDACVDVDNVLVADSKRFFCGNFDPDYWSEAEKAVFARRYALYPKQFGRIAAGLPDKNAQQCVRYYYIHKHQAGYDFKALSRERNRERRKKSKGRPKKAKGSALLADIATSKAADTETSDKKHKRQRSDGAESVHEQESPEPAASERDLAAAEALEALSGVARPEPKKSRARGSHWNAHEKAEFWRFLPVYGRDWAALSAALPSKSSAQARNFFARHASESPFFHEATAYADANSDLPIEERLALGAKFLEAWEQESAGATPMRPKEVSAAAPAAAAAAASVSASASEPPVGAPQQQAPVSASSASAPPAVEHVRAPPQGMPSSASSAPPESAMPAVPHGSVSELGAAMPPHVQPQPPMTPAVYAPYRPYGPGAYPHSEAPAKPQGARQSDDDETDEDSAPESAPQWSYGAPYTPRPGMYYSRDRMPVRYGPPPSVPYRGMPPYPPGSTRPYAPGTPYGYGYVPGSYDGVRRVPVPLRPAMGYFQLPGENPPQ
ncbi:DNA-binding protein snt1 [Malassezia cuniculi]|uniref:DNA-binding protein snt1 n=1 Tax=Malassezia cuniculi TaxID=948313 RepID=A0AAF0JBK0_9BASI|nr:DNA-binding protein snt1 [Malassezia cuniculi]